MKAAVIFENGTLPECVDLPEPVVSNDDELLVSVKAVAIKHFDKGRATGKHYSSDGVRSGGQTIGGDGVGVTTDGRRVYGIGVGGTMAEQAIMAKDRVVLLPDNLSDTTAAALGNAIIGSAMGLRFKAAIQPGEVVLVNGATGFTGRVAIQIARHYGAGKIIATGRNGQSLAELRELGADEIISIHQSDELIIAAIKQTNREKPIDVVIDYLWGHSAELILSGLRGKGSFTNPVRFVSVGSVTGDVMQLSASSLRSINLQLNGSGLGSWTREQVGKLFSEILPEMFQLAADGKLVVKTTEAALGDIARLWDLKIADGHRLVVTI